MYHPPLFTERLAILCLTTLISFASLTKTGCNVNKPDPDENRKAPQIVTSSIRFLLTSVPFHFFMTLFRVSCLAYFFAFYWKWTFLIIGVTILINVGILWSCKCSPTITVLLGKALKDFSIFKKNINKFVMYWIIIFKNFFFRNGFSIHAKWLSFIQFRRNIFGWHDFGPNQTFFQLANTNR